MRRRALGPLLLALAGCHNPADDLAKLDVANPSPAPGWVQFRHGPGGYAFQAPRGWALDAQDEAQRRMSARGLDWGLLVRIADGDAARKGDLVSFAATRLAILGEDGVDRLDRLKVYRLDEIGEKVLRGMKADVADARRERLSLPIGSAEHVWGTLERERPDGTRERMSSHIVAFATALRPFAVTFVYPAAKEAEYRPTLDLIVRSVRLFRPERGGKVEIPGSAQPAATAMPPAGGPAPTMPPRQTYGGGAPPRGMGAGGFENMPPNSPTPPAPQPDPGTGGAPVPPADPGPGAGEPPASGGAGSAEPPASGAGPGDPGSLPPGP